MSHSAHSGHPAARVRPPADINPDFIARREFSDHLDNAVQRGYLRFDVNQRDCVADFRIVLDPRRADSTVQTATVVSVRDL